jgi:protocatechuate 4,5-dioxygenase alpha chain
MSDKKPHDWDIPGTYVFDHTRSRMGYRLNKMAMSLTRPENRAAFKADVEAYMEKYHVPAEQRQAVRDKDWLQLIKLGGNIYLLIKIAEAYGIGLYGMGAQQRGETLEQFLETRSGKGAT